MTEVRHKSEAALRATAASRLAIPLVLGAILSIGAFHPATASALPDAPHAAAGTVFPGGSKPSASKPLPIAGGASSSAPFHAAPATMPHTAARSGISQQRQSPQARQGPPPRPSFQQRQSPPPRPGPPQLPSTQQRLNSPPQRTAQATPYNQPRYVVPYRQPAPQFSQHAYLNPQERPQAGYPQRFSQNPPRSGYPERPGSVNNGGDHLPQWMRQHQNQSPAEQERALRQEPGFNRLPPQQQENLINTLHRLNQMPPEQRARTLSRIENMERLSPQMKEAVRSSARALSTLPQDRRRLVQKAFRDLRDMPPEQRQAVMNSTEFAGQFSAQERSIMGNLLLVEPYQHAGPPGAQQQYGKQ